MSSYWLSLIPLFVDALLEFATGTRAPIWRNKTRIKCSKRIGERNRWSIGFNICPQSNSCWQEVVSWTMTDWTLCTVNYLNRFVISAVAVHQNCAPLSWRYVLFQEAMLWGKALRIGEEEKEEECYCTLWKYSVDDDTASVFYQRNIVDIEHHVLVLECHKIIENYKF